MPEVLATQLGEGASAAEIGVFILDDYGNYVAANEYGAALLGVSVEELLGRKASEFTVGNPPPERIPPMSHREGAQMVQRADGEWVPLAFVVVPTTVAGMAFRMSVVWRLEPDDPRAVAAAEQLAARLAAE